MLVTGTIAVCSTNGTEILHVTFINRYECLAKLIVKNIEFNFFSVVPPTPCAGEPAELAAVMMESFNRMYKWRISRLAVHVVL